MKRILHRSAAIFVFLVGGATAQVSLAETPASWDRAAAARYLDARMDLWWEKAKTLKTGDGETKCISCHTGVPYALARAELRRAEGQREPTANEKRMLEIVSQRVAYRDADQLYYDHSPAKKIESRGTEAVINALVLTQHDRDLAAKAPSELTVRAMTHLWDVQRADGSWDWLDFENEPAESSESGFQGAAIAALAIGSDAGMKASANEKGRKGIEKLNGYFQANVASQNLYNKAWALLASSRLPSVLTPAQKDAVIRDLDAAQSKDGGWAMSNMGPWHWSKKEAPFEPQGTLDAALMAQSDGFGTGLVVYAMRAAGRADSNPVVAKGKTWLLSHQTPQRADDPAWAPWRSYSLNHNREQGGPKGEIWRRMFMSDMATGFGALALQ
jgi:hypothetical protein